MNLGAMLMAPFRAVWRSLENPRRPLDPWQEGGGSEIGGDMSISGVRVSRRKALTVAGVWRAVNLVSEAVAKLPLGVYKAAGANRLLAPEHPAHRLLRVRPNPLMTPFVFKQTLTSHVMLEGNAYSYIFRAKSGRPLDLLVLDPRRTEPFVKDGVLWYVHELKGGEKRKLSSDDVLHFKGLGYDGLKGYSVISHACESLGLAIATTQYGGAFFRNSARPNMILTHPAKLSNEARKNLKESFDRINSGLENAHRTAVLEEGMEAIALQINARDAQLIESKQFSLVDIANWFGVKANQLGANVSTSYGSLEQDNQGFLDYGLDPRLVMWEEECEGKLLTEEERNAYTHCVSFDRFPLQRADSDKRANYYQKAINTGWMSFDEARAREGMNPQPGGVGATYARPLNLEFVGGDSEGSESAASGSGLIPLPDVRQREAWDCGPAAVASVMQHFGKEPSGPDELAAAMGSTPDRGTTPAAVLALLSRAGLTTTARGGMGVKDLARFHAAGQPVLCPCRPGGDAASGHWVAVTGVGLGMIFLQDPAAGPRMMAEADWLAIWQDADADGNPYERFGIAAGEDLLPPAADAGGGDPKPGTKPTSDDPNGDPEGKDGKEGNDDAGDARTRSAVQRVLGDTLLRMVRRVRHQAERKAADPAEFMRWLDGDLDGPTLCEMLEGPLEAWRAATGFAATAQPVSQRLTLQVREGLLAVAGVVDVQGLPAAVRSYFDGVEAAAWDLNVGHYLLTGKDQ